jgi:signal peptidase II
VTLVAAAVVILDQATKAAVLAWLPEGGWPAEPIGGLFSLVLVHNTGVAFGLLQGYSNVLLVLALVIVAVLAVSHHRFSGHYLVIRIAVGLQIGGAIGNIIDRVRHGHVIDFFKVGIWPVFNVADSAVVIGVLLLAFELWRDERARLRAGSMTAVAE